MNYEEFLENYVPELQLIEALDELKNYSLSAAETIDRMVSPSNTAKSVSECPQKDPKR